MQPDPTHARVRQTSRVIGWLSALVPASERDAWRREWQAEMAADDLGPQGRAKRGARLAAAARHALWLRWHQRRLEFLLQDVRHAARALARRPAFTTTAVLTLALGVGASTAIYGTVRAVMWRPLPFPGPSALTMVSTTMADAPQVAAPGSVSPPDFVDWRLRNTTFAGMTAIDAGGIVLTGVGVAERLSVARVAGDFFEVFGGAPVVGRLLAIADSEGAPAAVLSEALWRSRFGADPAVVGRTIVLDDIPTYVLGVAPRTLDFPRGTDIWVPLPFTPAELQTQRGAHYLTVVGRVRSGISVAQARADMTAVAAGLSAAYPKTNADSRASVVELQRALVGDVRPAMHVLFGAVTLVLLLACVNVANLVMGGSLDRAKDLSVRAALGAGRGRLLRGLFVESAILAGAGGLMGLGLAALAVRLVAASETQGVPSLDQTRIDGGVLLYSMIVTSASVLLFGLLPAWRATRHDLTPGIGGGAGRTTSDARGTRHRRVLVAAELALAVALLVGAGLMARTFAALVRSDLGYDGVNVQTFALTLPESRYSLDRRRALVSDLLADVAAKPDVASAAAAFGLPQTGINYFISGYARDGQRLDDEESDRLTMQLRVVSPAYFEALGIHVHEGRAFSESDQPGRPTVAIVSAAAAALIWPGQSALGRTFSVGTRLGLGGERAGGQIVGVVDDVRDAGPAASPRPMLYVTYAQFPVDSFNVVVKAKREAAGLIPALRAAVARLDGNLPVFAERSMAELGARAVAQPRLILALLAAFSAAAIGLAAVGVYGVIAQNVASRRREIGIRLALGAERPRVVRAVLGDALLLAAAGVLAGWGIAALAQPVTRGVIFGVAPTDSTTYALVAAVTFVIATLAAYVPARRASRIDPAVVLRAD